MAKGSNIITHGLSGTIDRITFVKSKKYKEHIRSKRGSIKPALINERLQENSQQLGLAVLPARAIFNAVRSHHKDGYLWNKLLGIFRKQLKAGIPFHINDLKGMECHKEFSLDRLILNTWYKVQIVQKEDKLCIELVMKEHPDWSYLEWKRDFQYRLSMVIVYPNLETGGFTEETAHGPVTEFTTPVQPLSFEVPIPGSADKYVAFMLAATCEDGEVSRLAHTNGMRVVGVGERAV
ncbi:MAG TPA: hypothetical protein VGM41_05045 [Chitinophagaceae bacterium]